MSTARTSLDQFYRNLLRAFAVGVLVATLIGGLALAVLAAVSPTPAGMLYLGSIGLLFVGVVVTLNMLKRYPIAVAVIPLCATFLIGEVSVGLFAGGATLLIGPALVFVVLLAGLANDRRVSIAMAVLSALIGLALVLANLQNDPVVEVAQVVSVLVLVGGVWFVMDRLLRAQNAALAMIEQRAAEAERATEEVTSVRVELERRNAELENVLELVQTLELPVISVGEGVLVVPLVGNLDSRRAQAMQRQVLNAVAESPIHTVVIDVTGVAVIDTAVAVELVQTAQALRLLGARSLLSGITPEIARTLSSLRVDLDVLQSIGNLGQALDLVRDEQKANPTKINVASNALRR